jgi:hypothetical protein
VRKKGKQRVAAKRDNSCYITIFIGGLDRFHARQFFGALECFRVRQRLLQKGSVCPSKRLCDRQRGVSVYFLCRIRPIEDRVVASTRDGFKHRLPFHTQCKNKRRQRRRLLTPKTQWCICWRLEKQPPRRWKKGSSLLRVYPSRSNIKQKRRLQPNTNPTTPGFRCHLLHGSSKKRSCGNNDNGEKETRPLQRSLKKSLHV